MTYYPEFSQILLECLDRIDRPPAWLARRLGVNPSTVNRWMNHGSRPGDSELIVRMADLLHATDRLQEILVAAGYGYQEAPDDAIAHGDAASDGDDAAGEASEQSEESPRPAIPTNLPVQTITMIGREDELAALGELCADPAVRLVTILGPGGMGKSKLALAFAEKQYTSSEYPDGVFYVPLAAISKRHNMVTAIADALGLSSSGRDMETSVLRQLQNMDALVVLDNFEQLIPEADFLTTLLDATPSVSVIVTSRARLNLHEEWAIDLQGLSYPKTEVRPSAAVEDLYRFDAISMFIQRIEQINSGYDPTEEDIRLAAEIARLVQGMPLALELAAGWSRYMMLDEIIGEIKRSMDFFSTTMRNVPERHRSLRAVFHQSWQMLTAEEQQAYAALSVFRGGFSRQAAAEVTGVSLPVIASLVDKSLISRVQAGHYEAQDMLRQFATEILAKDPARESAARLAHAAFYCGYLADRTEDLHSSRQLTALHEISAELENIRSAWNTSVEQKQYELQYLGVEGWYLLSELGGYIQQGYWGLNLALDAVENGDLGIQQDSKLERRLLYAKLLARHAMMRMRYGGSYPNIIDGLERALSITSELHEEQDLDVADEMVFDMNKLGLMHYFAGDEDRAELLIRGALEIAMEQGNNYETGNAWSNLAHLDEFQGRFISAAAMFSKSIEYYSLAGESNRRAYSLNNWGRAAYGMGDYEHAESLVLQALAIRREFNDLVGIAYSLLDLGEIADCLGDYEAAEQFMQEGLSVARTIDNDETVMRYYMGLADLARHTGNLIMAESYLNRARDISRELVIPSHTPLYLAGLGKVAYQRRGAETARSLFEESLSLAVDLGNEGIEAEIRFSIAKLDLEQGNYLTSANYLTRSLEISIETGASPVALAGILLAARFHPDLMPEEFAPRSLLEYVIDNPAAWHHTHLQAHEILNSMIERDGDAIADGVTSFGRLPVPEVALLVVGMLEPLATEQITPRSLL